MSLQPAGNKKLKKATGAQKEPPKEDPLFPSRPKNLRIGGDVRVCDVMSSFIVSFVWHHLMFDVVVVIMCSPKDVT